MATIKIRMDDTLSESTDILASEKGKEKTLTMMSCSGLKKSKTCRAGND